MAKKFYLAIKDIRVINVKNFLLYSLSFEFRYIFSGYRHLSLKIQNIEFNIDVLLGNTVCQNLMSKIENEYIS